MNGSELHELLDGIFDRLFPILRSITGPGIEQSYDILAEQMPLERHAVASGTKVFDWTVPPEWRCRAARLTGPDGSAVCDIDDNNLHVVNYSEAVDRTLTLRELEPHIHSVPSLPGAIPYVTSYYDRTWGFCLSHDQWSALPDGEYHAFIDAGHVEGEVPLAEATLDGDSDREILLTSYLCHPSLANNELSGPLALLGLYKLIAAWPRRRHRFRFALMPETIGSLCYLHLFGDDLRERLDAGIVLTCLGGPAGTLSYKQSRLGRSRLDRLAALHAERGTIELRDFTPTSGSDERQFCSPGFDLPVGQLARTLYGTYPEYHTSLDTKDFMSVASVVDSVRRAEALLLDLDTLGPYINLQPFGEPQLGRRNLYPAVNSPDEWARQAAARAHMMHLLSLGDGEHDLVDVARRAGCMPSELIPTVELLERHGLLVHAPAD